METSQFICIVNQLTGFYIKLYLGWHELITLTNHFFDEPGNSKTDSFPSLVLTLIMFCSGYWCLLTHVWTLRYLANVYQFKVNNRNNRKRCEMCLKVIIKTPKRRRWRRFGASIVKFEHISQLFLVLLLLTLSLLENNCLQVCYHNRHYCF